MWYDGQTKLTEKQVINIINSKEPCVVLAKKYNLTPTAISKIQLGTNWKRIHKRLNTTPRSSKYKRCLDETIVRAIKNFEVNNFDELAKQYDVDVRYLKSLQNPKMITAWKHIPVKGYEDIKSIPPVRHRTDRKIVRDIFLNRHISANEMADKYSVSLDVVYSIRSGKRHSKYTSKLQLD